jgi:hypothetical protein
MPLFGQRWWRTRASDLLARPVVTVVCAVGVTDTAVRLQSFLLLFLFPFSLSLSLSFKYIFNYSASTHHTHSSE